MNYDNSTILFGSIQLYPPQSVQSLKVRSAKALPDFKKDKKEPHITANNAAMQGSFVQ